MTQKPNQQEQSSEIEAAIQERFASLPEAVRNAVADESVEKKLRALASKYKLHLDQWVVLENEIMMTLIGLEEPENMAKNVAKEVGTDEETAQKIVNDIAREIFTPIREKLQGSLTREPLTRESKKVSHTPETPKETEPGKKEKTRPSDSTEYRSGQTSTERLDVQDDPYRESI